MATVLITGGTGMIGTALSKLLLGNGHHVIIVTRSVKVNKPGDPHLRYATWDTNQQKIEEAAIRDADHIVNLAGAGIGDKRWTQKRKKELLESRVNSATTIVKALREIPNNVKAVIQAAGIDWYPEDPAIPNNSPFTEEAPLGPHFLSSLCREWEASIQPVTTLGKRLVILRSGVVFSRRHGALDQFERPIRFGIAPILGNGRQVMSWIHIHDIVRMYAFAIDNDQMRGVYNAVARTPVSNRTFILELATVMSGRLFLPVRVPAFFLRLLVGEMSDAVLKSTTVSSEKISREGFEFKFPAIEEALFNIAKS